MKQEKLIEYQDFDDSDRDQNEDQNMEPSDGLDPAMCEVFAQNIKMENVFEENHEEEQWVTKFILLS